MTDETPTRDALAGVFAEHRWKDMGVDWCSCECGAILHGEPGLTEFPADEAFRLHLADAILASDVLDRVRAEGAVNALENAAHDPDEPFSRKASASLMRRAAAIRAESRGTR